MKIIVLGSGTSTGVPVPTCGCPVCTSSDSLNKRLRTSVYLEVKTPSSHENMGILIDTSPDLRYQSLRARLKRIDAVLYTHVHADHIFGIDDLRAFNFVKKNSIQVFAESKTADDLESKFHYCFSPDPNYQGGAAPKLTLQRIGVDNAFHFEGLEIIPLRLFHGKMPILGFRIGGFAYLTDCNFIPPESLEKLQNLDVLFLDALRERPHSTHFTLQEAVQQAEIIGAKQTYLIHLSHEIDHQQANRQVRESTDLAIELAYDGLTLEI